MFFCGWIFSFGQGNTFRIFGKSLNVVALIFSIVAAYFSTKFSDRKEALSHFSNNNRLTEEKKTNNP
jgi:hypothetical protein